MQQLQLFVETNIYEFKKWQISFIYHQLQENDFIGELSVPSWKFIIKFSYYNNKILTFEIIDYLWYLYINVWLIKTIKKLTDAIIKKSRV